MLEATFEAFQDELEKIAVTMSTASPRLRHAYRRLADWKKAMTLGPKGVERSIEEASQTLPKTMRKSMLEKGKHVEKHFGAPLRAPAFKGKSVMFAKPEPTKVRKVPR